MSSVARGRPTRRAAPGAPQPRRTSTRLARTAGVMVPSTLFTLAGLHVAWAFGSPWPADSPEALARHLADADTMPAAGETLPVAAALLTASGVVAAVAAGVRARPVRAAAWCVGGVLLIRAGAFVPSDLRGGAATAFERLDLTVYAPLCLLLSGGTVAILRRRDS